MSADPQAHKFKDCLCGKCAEISRRRFRAVTTCDDCQRYTEGFMVTSRTWQEAGFTSHKGIICLPCFTARLKRKLVRADFPRIPINVTIHAVLDGWVTRG